MAENPLTLLIPNETSADRTTRINVCSQTPRLVDASVISLNRHNAGIVWFDRKIDPKDLRTQSLSNQLNDRVEVFNDTRDCINYLYECRETVLFITSGKCAEECLHSIHSLLSIDSIIIYCATPKRYDHLIDDNYRKIIACIASEAELIQCVHKWIDFKCQLHFYTWTPHMPSSTKLTAQTSLFLANYLLPRCIEYHAHGRYKSEMMEICLAYYAQHPYEYDQLKEFELTYTPDDAIHWYTRNSFVHKIVNRTLRSFDSVKRRAIAFYIEDLCLQLHQLHRTTPWSAITTVYHGLVMTQADINRIQSTTIGSLISVNGFLSTSRNKAIALAFAAKKQNALTQPLNHVLLEIQIDVENTSTVFADVALFSAFPEENEILFTLGAVFCLQGTYYEEEAHTYGIKLTLATQKDHNSIEQLLKIAEEQLGKPINDDGPIALVDKLLNIDRQPQKLGKKSEDYEQNSSLFRAAFSNLWHSNQEICKQLFNETMPWIPKIYHYLHHHQSNTERSICSTKRDPDQYDEMLLARFEPILFFHLDGQLMKEERANLSTVFQWQYRRFITTHLTLMQMEENLNEHYYIYYISSELPMFMRENLRIKFYPLEWSSEDQNAESMKIKVMERLRSQLLHDLGMFYSEQAKSASTGEENLSIARALRKKGAKCYELLAEESEKIIRRYQDN